MRSINTRQHFNLIAYVVTKIATHLHLNVAAPQPCALARLVNPLSSIVNHLFTSPPAARHTLLLLCLITSTQVAAQGIERRPDGFSVSLSSQVQEAVENGVALTFACEFAMINRFLFISWPRQKHEHQFVVTHHALSNRYIVRQGQQQNQHSFRSLDASMNYMASEAQRLYSDYLNNNSRYEVRLSLSKYELPGPIRLSAFLSSDWDLDTGWVKWDSEH